METTNPTGYNIASETFTLNPPTKTGYTFVGWSGTEIDSIASDVTIEQGSASNREYTANWSINSYRLDIIAGTGISTVNGDGLHEYDSSVTASCTMLAGYEFDKWTGDITTETFNMPASNATMTANAKLIVYNITYNLDGGQLTEDNPVNYDVTSATITLNAPTKDGFTFTGWSGTGLTGNENMTVTIEQGSTGNREYTANWSINSYRLDIIAGTGINTVIGANTYEYGTEVTASCTMLAGYEFDSWSGDFTTETFNMPASNATMTANAKPIVYNIAYNLDGGQPTENNPMNYDVTSATITLHNPTKEGYNFTGWSGTGLTGNENMTVTIEQGSTGNKEFTANYSPINYNIVYILNGGTVATPNPTTYDVTSATINLNNPTKPKAIVDGYTVFYLFGGWTGTDIDSATTTVTIAQGSMGYREYTANWVLLEMKSIEAGTFTMGSPAGELGRQSNDETQHDVTISNDFYIGKYEVTQDLYFAIMGTNPSNFRGGLGTNVRLTTTASCPVECVSWNDIMTTTTGFIDKINTQLASQIPAGYRFDLPTEAQWEYACRAGTTTSLNNNTNITVTEGTCPNLSMVGWYSTISENKTHDVGGKAPNAWGLYDMHGNVWEWCKDWYGSYPNSAVTDPIGASGGSYRVGRGGGWVNNPNNCRSGFRGGGNPSSMVNFVGLRLVLVKTS